VNRLYDQLISYSRKDYYPMHMPGHKRNTNLLKMGNPYEIDITEIEGFDNLHQAEGILKQLALRLSALYGARRSFPLINGSTAGILAGICAAVNRGDSVLLARNCHKSVYHAATLMGLTPEYCYPPLLRNFSVNGGISADEIEEVLIRNQKIRLVVITSPTYEGIVSDIGAIASAVHRHGALLFVDEAHGAHFGFHESFPASAVGLGADLVVQSLHKTLPAFTQTAVLHSNVAALDSNIEKYLSIFQSSSPSYVLMAGIDRCISMLEDNREELFKNYDNLLKDFRNSIKDLKHLKLLDREALKDDKIFDLDPSKITISVRDTELSGHQLFEILREKYHIVLEMEAPDYVLGMTGIGDTGEGLNRLSEALLEIDDTLTPSGKKEKRQERIFKPERVMILQKALEQKTEQVKLTNSSNRITAAFISPFPPGSPLLAPGERITGQILREIQWLQQEEITITGITGEQKDEIEVICE
jgi:arginine/lysine/ornithine decarboxylase